MTPSSPLPSVANLRKAVPTSTGLKDALTGFADINRTAAVEPIRALAFYAAIVLPLVYLPLIANGITAERLTIIAGLLLANAAALVLGHGHGSR
ncbi:hypothetical protein [Halobaculum gomorrense]|uniref:Uncharacterized protein n=1 Tax=Halobaculum gomorrense TaxID=43928 RepID=A0A1M5TMK5_9EURY|nr:hypothetical protein [Halobaculum gomorrense]SHH51944.1 hypothetical protein SAMN05443636_2769 [Halobaculum gomorrense]